MTCWFFSSRELKGVIKERKVFSAFSSLCYYNSLTLGWSINYVSSLALSQASMGHFFSSSFVNKWQWWFLPLRITLVLPQMKKLLSSYLSSLHGASYQHSSNQVTCTWLLLLFHIHQIKGKIFNFWIESIYFFITMNHILFQILLDR